MRDLILQDIRFAARQLRQNPVFTLVAVLSLALGIGANTAIFQLVDSIILKMLPVQHPDQIAAVDFPRNSKRSGWFSTRSARFTYAQWEQVRARGDSFSNMMAWSAARFNLADGGEARYAEGLYVSNDFFRGLGVEAILGRTFGPNDDTQACENPGAVISHAFWQREFGLDGNILSRQVRLDGHSLPVIGVTPRSFFGVEVGRQYDVAIPLCADRMLAEDHVGRIPVKHAWWITILGRLKPDWTVARANAHYQAQSRSIMETTVPPRYKPNTIKDYLDNKLVVTEAGTGVSGLRRQYSRPLWLLGAATGLVLLIACANLANLLLARASVRRREIAVRMAIGASRWRVVRQLLVESLILVAGGSAVGLLLARGLSKGLLSFLNTADSPLFVGLTPDARLLAFLAGLALLTCLLFGLLPSLRATALAPAEALRAGGRSVTSGKEGFSLRRALVVTQVALSLVLLVGALLFVRSLRNLMTTDAGFQAEGVLLTSVDYSRAQVPPERRLALQRELSRRLAAIPGVQSGAAVMFTPVSGSGWNNDIGPDGTPAAASGKQSFFNRADPGYFHTMGTSILAGRDINESDTPNSPKVAVVNEMFAQKFFGGVNPVGRTFRLEAEAGKAEPLYQIVGLVKNAKVYELREEFLPMAFLPLSQDDTPWPNGNWVLRVAGSPLQITAAVKKTVAEMSPAYGVEFKAFSAQLQESLLRERLMAALSTAFAVLAGMLAALGLYGVISFMVARRRNEIGLRMALGAGRTGVIRLVLREAALLLGAGLVAGLLVSYWAGKAADTLLYGLKGFDPVAIGCAVGLLSATSLMAAWGPARRAASLDPMTALRDE